MVGGALLSVVYKPAILSLWIRPRNLCAAPLILHHKWIPGLAATYFSLFQPWNEIKWKLWRVQIFVYECCMDANVWTSTVHAVFRNATQILNFIPNSTNLKYIIKYWKSGKIYSGKEFLYRFKYENFLKKLIHTYLQKKSIEIILKFFLHDFNNHEESVTKSETLIIVFFKGVKKNYFSARWLDINGFWYTVTTISTFLRPWFDMQFQ